MMDAITKLGDVDISAKLITNERGEVWFVDPESEIPCGYAAVGTMSFTNGKCVARSFPTAECAALLAFCTEAFAEFVCARLRERPDYKAWRQKILAMPPTILAN